MYVWITDERIETIVWIDAKKNNFVAIQPNITVICI